MMVGLNRWTEGKRLQFEIVYSSPITSSPRRVKVHFVDDNGDDQSVLLNDVRIVGQTIRGWTHFIEEGF